MFAAGIVLYQLTVGKLPFEGKNPHEVLKRIAECKFVDPRQANPRIGNRLGRIILRAMARAARRSLSRRSARWCSRSRRYLDESGLPSDKIAGELARYFKAPASYEQALKERLVDHADPRAASKLLDDDNRAGALDVFDRVLTIDPENAKVLAILDRLNRRARLKTGALAALGVARDRGRRVLRPRAAEAAAGRRAASRRRRRRSRRRGRSPSRTTIRRRRRAPTSRRAPGSAVAIAAAPRDADVDESDVDAAAAIEPTVVTIRVLPHSQFSLDGGATWQKVTGHDFPVSVTRSRDRRARARPAGDHRHTVHVEPGAKVVNAGQQFRPASITPRCASPACWSSSTASSRGSTGPRRSRSSTTRCRRRNRSS